MKNEIISRIILLIAGIVVSCIIYMTRSHEYSWYICISLILLSGTVFFVLRRTMNMQKRSSIYLMIPMMVLSIIEVLILKDEPAKMFIQTLCGCSLFGAGVFLLMDGEKMHKERKQIKIKHEEKK